MLAAPPACQGAPKTECFLHHCSQQTQHVRLLATPVAQIQAAPQAAAVALRAAAAGGYHGKVRCPEPG